jgi:hypothetical protein
MYLQIVCIFSFLYTAYMSTWYINKCPFCNSYSVCFYYKNGGFLTVDCGREEIYILYHIIKYKQSDNTAG